VFDYNQFFKQARKKAIANNPELSHGGLAEGLRWLMKA